MGYAPPFDITNQMLTLVSQISEKVGKISVTSNLQAKPHLRKNNRIKSIHSSLKIEANSLTIGQVRDVINGKIVFGEQKEIQEVKNAYDAYERISQINPFDINELKGFHKIMMRYLVHDAGEFRKGEEGVFSGDKCIFMAPPARIVPELMENLFNWLYRNKGEIHPLIIASVFHYEFVFIHPFVDGNGRMARLWHSVFLSKWNQIFEYIPLESQIERFQEEYYSAIAKCHSEGSANTFIMFILEQINKTLDEIAEQISQASLNLSECVIKLINAMEYDTPYTMSSIMALLNLQSKETVRRNYIHPALELDLIQMTIPNKPRSRNQRYIKK
jgi:Fic family protein